MPSDELGKQIWRIIMSIVYAYERHIISTVRKLFADDIADVKAALMDVLQLPVTLAVVEPPKGSPANVVLDWSVINEALEDAIRATGDRWREELFPVTRTTLQAAGDNIGGMFGVSFSLYDPAVLDYIHEHEYAFIESIQAVSLDVLRDKLRASYVDGASVLDLMNDLDEIYVSWIGYRAELVARTEVIRAANGGAYWSYNQAGFVEVMWWSARDANTCNFCRSLHGAIIGIGEAVLKVGAAMKVGDMQMKNSYITVYHPPLHPLCRCTIVPHGK